MVEFLTVFLGLATGLQVVELNVAGPVATVEVRLDGEPLATLTGAPWVVECDLGAAPLPHELVAVARDDAGRELDRAETWINLAPQLAAATLAVDTDEAGRARALRLDWQSIGEPEPERLEATFDGRPLDVTDPRHVPLPSHDARDFHYVSAEVDFANDQRSRRETEFGGARSQKVSTELTAVVVQLERRMGLPSPARMATWFLEDGRPLEVHGVESGTMSLFVVRGTGAQDLLDQLAGSVLRDAYQPVVRYSYRRQEGPLATSLDWQPETFFAGDVETIEERIREHRLIVAPLRHFAPLDEKVGLRFVSPSPGPLTPSGLEPAMFVHSRVYAGREGGLSWLVQQHRPASFEAMTHEALTVAGMMARADNRRRAVLLITTGAADASVTPAADVRAFLRALQVPLYVWSFGPADPGWGDDVVDLGDPGEPSKVATRLEKATAALQRDLKRQRVVWLEGRLRPHRIELGPNAKGIRLAGS